MGKLLALFRGVKVLVFHQARKISLMLVFPEFRLQRAWVSYQFGGNICKMWDATLCRPTSGASRCPTFYSLTMALMVGHLLKVYLNVVAGSTSLVRNTMEIIKLGVQNRLDSASIDFDAVPGLSELFSGEERCVTTLVTERRRLHAIRRILVWK